MLNVQLTKKYEAHRFKLIEMLIFGEQKKIETLGKKPLRQGQAPTTNLIPDTSLRNQTPCHTGGRKALLSCTRLSLHANNVARNSCFHIKSGLCGYIVGHRTFFGSDFSVRGCYLGNYQWVSLTLPGLK